MIPDRHPLYSRLNATSSKRRNGWFTHRSLDLVLLAGSACLLTLMIQPIAAALTQN